MGLGFAALDGADVGEKGSNGEGDMSAYDLSVFRKAEFSITNLGTLDKLIHQMKELQ